MWKVSRAVWPSSRLMRVGIMLARHLNQDAVVALALDGRLAGADLVDPPAHDLERLADRGAHALGPALLGEADAEPAVAVVLR